MSTRLLVLGDLHLGAALPEWRNLGDRRRADLETALRTAAALAVDSSENVDAVLVSGDLLDRPDPSLETAALVSSAIAGILERGVPVVVLPGDCDPLEGSTFEYGTGCLPEGVVLVRWGAPEHRAIPLRQGMLHLYSFARIPGRTPADPWAQVRRMDAPGAHVGLFHAEVVADGEPPVSSIALPLPGPALAASGLDVAIVGRSHDFREQRSGNVTLVTPGSPVGLGPRETGERGFALITIDEGNVTVERRSSGAPAVTELEIAVGTGDAEDQIFRRVTRSRGVGFARVVLRGNVRRALDLDGLAARLGDRGIVTDWVDATEIVPGDTGDGVAADPVLSLFVSVMRERIAAATSDEHRALLGQALRVGAGAWRDRDGRHAA